MPSIDINFVMPSLLKVGAEGVIRVQPISEVDQTKAKIDDLTLTLPGGESHAVIDYQRGFEFSDWTFSFLVPQSFHSVIGPSTMAIVSFKILADGQVFQTLDDCIICVDTDINKPPFSVASITPTTIQLDAQSTAQVLVKGKSLDKAYASCNLAGPSPVYAAVTGISATSCTVVIKGSDVPVLGKYRILLYEETTQDTFIVPIDLSVEGKSPTPNLKLLSIAPDVLAPGDSFKLNISKDVATSGWDDVRIIGVQIDEASGYTSNARHGHINPVSNTECSVDCILSSAVKVLANEKATLKLLATYKMESANVTNTLALTLHPDPRTPKFNVSSCLPFRASKQFAKSPGCLFSLTGIHLDQITSFNLGNAYRMDISSQTAFRIQCRFLTPPNDIKEGVYQFTVKYDDPQSGTEKTEILQNVNVEITPP
ncbi:hypothetical protein [Verminephrobacter aporrectodeae]|uniref:hypothetical protein n=1 Tax=Verminephrobacter aporrectodeae TaxID=1110389 RepID=UPI0002D3C5BB|nr:hypothetical protein [Verminephrobacter aporrectodeae]